MLCFPKQLAGGLAVIKQKKKPCGACGRWNFSNIRQKRNSFALRGYFYRASLRAPTSRGVAIPFAMRLLRFARKDKKWGY